MLFKFSIHDFLLSWILFFIYSDEWFFSTNRGITSMLWRNRINILYSFVLSWFSISSKLDLFDVWSVLMLWMMCLRFIFKFFWSFFNLSLWCCLLMIINIHSVFWLSESLLKGIKKIRFLSEMFSRHFISLLIHLKWIFFIFQFFIFNPLVLISNYQSS